MDQGSPVIINPIQKGLLTNFGTESAFESLDPLCCDGAGKRDVILSDLHFTSLAQYIRRLGPVQHVIGPVHCVGSHMLRMLHVPLLDEVPKYVFVSMANQWLQVVSI